MITREPTLRERNLAHLVTVHARCTAAGVAEAYELRLKATQNVLAAMLQVVPWSNALEGTGIKNDPRQYRTLAPHFEGFGNDDAQDMIPPDPPPSRGSAGGNHFQGPKGEAGNDRWTQ